MQKHTKIYMCHFGYGIEDFIPCEVCGNRSADIHHIHGRGKGKDVIENLMALCRSHHNDCHDELIKKENAQLLHNYFMRNGLTDPELLGVNVPEKSKLK